jgi:hypothetical protein
MVILSRAGLFKMAQLSQQVQRKFAIRMKLEAGTLRYTEYTQKNGAISKVNKKFISHLTRAQPSEAATVQVSRALPAVRFSCLLGAKVKFLEPEILYLTGV